MRLGASLEEAFLVRRLDRFLTLVNLKGRPVQAHLPNSGRLRDLLVPGQRVLVAPRGGVGRKSPYDLVMVSLPHTLVSIDARLPNLLVQEALEVGSLAELQGYTHLRREERYAGSRLDFLLEGGGRCPSVEGRCWLEVKSVTLVQGGCALFPDAPTLRGARHLEALAQACRAGDRGAVLFVVQRSDAHSFAPHDAADPAFGDGLRQAAAAGVEVRAYACQVSPYEVRLVQSLAVYL